MNAILPTLYPWIKSAHIIFVIFWMAGLFMLPRFYIYHQEAPQGSDEDAKWVEREQKLRKIILLPSIILVWIFGLILAWQLDVFSQGWFHAKLSCVVILSGYHGWLISYGNKLAAGYRPLSGKTLRMLNEIPGIAVALIVVMVIIRPF